MKTSSNSFISDYKKKWWRLIQRGFYNKKIALIFFYLTWFSRKHRPNHSIEIYVMHAFHWLKFFFSFVRFFFFILWISGNVFDFIVYVRLRSLIVNVMATVSICYVAHDEDENKKWADLFFYCNFFSFYFIHHWFQCAHWI